MVEGATGATLQLLGYSPFGVVEHELSAPGFDQPFRFAGGLWDPDTGLLRFGARDYDPQLGRWTAKDPIGFGGGDTNLYAYAGSDPVDYVDLDGRNPILVIIAIGFVFSVATDQAGDTSHGDVVGFIPLPALRLAKPIGFGAKRVLGACVRFARRRAGSVAASGRITDPARLLPERAGPTGHISPSEVIGRTPVQIDARARELGLQPRGPDPAGGRGAYIDPHTGQQRILSHPSGSPPHGHVNNPAGQRIGADGRIVPPESPEAHLPILVP